jgi:hypothetical protein
MDTIAKDISFRDKYRNVDTGYEFDPPPTGSFPNASISYLNNFRSSKCNIPMLSLLLNFNYVKSKLVPFMFGESYLDEHEYMTHSLVNLSTNLCVLDPTKYSRSSDESQLRFCANVKDLITEKEFSKIQGSKTLFDQLHIKSWVQIQKEVMDNKKISNQNIFNFVSIHIK